MAANSAFLAVQYAAGVPVPRYELRRNPVTKTHKTTIMVANPTMQCEATDLASIPRLLHRNSVSMKRNKTIVAAYPDFKLEVEMIPGIPEYTKGVLENLSEQKLKLDDKTFWAGDRKVTLPKHISNETVEFTQNADTGGSIGAVEYVFPGDEYKWIIAWSNSVNDLNKVYTEILQDDADWTQIRENLNKSGQISIFDGIKHNVPYSSKVVIDKTSPTPTMTVYIFRADQFNAGDFVTDTTFAANIINKNTIDPAAKISKNGMVAKTDKDPNSAIEATGATSSNSDAVQQGVEEKKPAEPMPTKPT